MLKLYIIASVFLVTFMKKNYRLIFATIISLSLINCGGSENVTNEENTEQKEQLFKLKLKLFEEDVVKSSKKRTAKTDLRKAETPVEAIAAYAKFL